MRAWMKEWYMVDIQTFQQIQVINAKEYIEFSENRKNPSNQQKQYISLIKKNKYVFRKNGFIAK